MGRLQLLSITAILFYGSIALAGLSTSKKELERAAELAVERAAERAAERAVEKALNSGNSSTITVTVKESYSNAKKTAEEQAAPGSESTRPYDPKIYDRQYGYSSPDDYKMNSSAEADELGISKDSLNSSVEDIGLLDLPSGDKTADSIEPSDLSFESVKEVTGTEKIKPSSIKDFDPKLSPDFGADFTDLDISTGDASFGLKSNTKTFSSSYSKPKENYSGKNVEINDEEGAEIFKMYAGEFSNAGWSTSKQDGWVRHRPLWDDSKSRVSRDNFDWDDFSGNLSGDLSGDVITPKSKAMNSKKTKAKIQKRMAEVDKSDHIVVPLATLSLDPKTPAALYQLLQRDSKFPLPENKHEGKIPMPMKLYVTIPVPYLPAYSPQKNFETKKLNSKLLDFTVASKQLDDKISGKDTLLTNKPFKRDFNIKVDGSPVFDSASVKAKKTQETPKKRPFRSILNVPLDQLIAESFDIKVPIKSV